MQDRDSLPVRDTLRLGGYYDPKGFISDGDITYGREIDSIFDTQKKQDGGSIEKGRDGMITRRQAFASAGVNDEGNVPRSLLRQTYRGLKDQFRNEGLRGEDLRQAARTAMMASSTPDLGDVEVEDITVPEYVMPELKPDNLTNVIIKPYVENLDKYSFGDAFARASKRGDKTFN